MPTNFEQVKNPEFSLQNGVDRYDFLFVLQTAGLIAYAIVQLYGLKKIYVEAQFKEQSLQFIDNNKKWLFYGAVLLIALAAVALLYIFRKVQDSNKEQQTTNAVNAAASTSIQAAQAAQQAANVATSAATTAQSSAITTISQTAGTLPR